MLGNLAAAAQALQKVSQNTTQAPPMAAPQQNTYSYSPTRTNMNELQEQIRTKRKALGWSQRELAARCNMSQGTITRAERHGWISLTCLIRIALALNEKLIISN